MPFEFPRSLVPSARPPRACAHAEHRHIGSASSPFVQGIRRILSPSAGPGTRRASHWLGSSSVSELAKDETHQRLMTVPGVRPVTAVAFIATLGNPKRFHGPKQVRAYLGLVPREHSSGEKALRGRIAKQGSGRMRRLLVQAACTVLRSKPTPEAEILKRWTTNVA
ncbi:MAG: transposase [Polyangia bacterium]